MRSWTQCNHDEQAKDKEDEENEEVKVEEGEEDTTEVEEDENGEGKDEEDEKEGADGLAVRTITGVHAADTQSSSSLIPSGSPLTPCGT